MLITIPCPTWVFRDETGDRRYSDVNDVNSPRQVSDFCDRLFFLCHPSSVRRAFSPRASRKAATGHDRPSAEWSSSLSTRNDLLSPSPRWRMHRGTRRWNSRVKLGGIAREVFCDSRVNRHFATRFPRLVIALSPEVRPHRRLRQSRAARHPTHHLGH
jgi:hypothetical protein